MPSTRVPGLADRFAPRQVAARRRSASSSIGTSTCSVRFNSSTQRIGRVRQQSLPASTANITDQSSYLCHVPHPRLQPHIGPPSRRASSGRWPPTTLKPPLNRVAWRKHGNRAGRRRSPSSTWCPTWRVCRRPAPPSSTSSTTVHRHLQHHRLARALRGQDHQLILGARRCAGSQRSTSLRPPRGQDHAYGRRSRPRCRRCHRRKQCTMPVYTAVTRERPVQLCCSTSRASPPATPWPWPMAIAVRDRTAACQGSAQQVSRH